MRVHFRLADAAEDEHGNVKAAEGNNRLFVLVAPGESGHDFMAEEDGKQGKELVVLFEYRPATLADWSEEERLDKKKPPLQKDLVALATERILAATDAALTEWLRELGAPHIMVNGETADYCRLEAHLKRYTARNTFDYFIHKDLGIFLRRELDFYIKNEVMHLDDVEHESAPRVEQYISKIKVIRKIAGKIIAFLEQLEDFQKKLWLKKKFVAETQYCITLGIIPVTFYAEIAANNSQVEEWVELIALDEIKGDLTIPSYTEVLEAEFLKAHPTLVVDTRHFGANFKARLLDAIGDVDEQADGVLFQSENLQARIVKVVRLESYEDSLNNLETRRTDVQQDLLDSVEAQGTDGFRERYMLRYMLDVETRDSQSLLNVRAFSDPTAYKLKVKRPGSDESREVNIDLLETFNWLIGLTVRHIAAPQTFNAAFERDCEGRLQLRGRLMQEKDGPYWFQAVTGTTPDGRRTLVI